eukprot:3828110-Ditylum_brightwellii.AAC.1
MGIPCEGPAYIYGDNQSILANTIIPDSTLKKKSRNLLMELLPDEEKRKTIAKQLLQYIYDIGEEDAEMSMAMDKACMLNN